MAMIRNAQPADAQAIGHVHVQSWQDAYRGLLPDDFLDTLSVERRQSMWAQVMARQRPYSGLLVAEVNEQIVGFASWLRPRLETGYDTEGELETIYLLSSYWGQGLGYALFLGLRQAAAENGCKSLGLWVLDNNKRGIHFYKRVGFVLDRQRVKVENFGPTQVTELRFVLPLLPAASPAAN